MNHILEVIYDTSDAENLTEVDEFLATLDKFSSEHPDIEVLYHEWNNLTEEEKEDLRDRCRVFADEEDANDEDEDFDDEDDEDYSSKDSDDDDDDFGDDSYDDDFDDEIEEEDEEDIRIPMILFNDSPVIEGYYPNTEELQAAITSALENKDFGSTEEQDFE